MEEAVARLAAKVQHPVLTDIAIDGAPVDLVELYPGELPDLFAGEELVVLGRDAVRIFVRVSRLLLDVKCSVTLAAAFFATADSVGARYVIFDQLGGGGSTSRSSNGVTTISRGNPDLKSITATNFDLSGEWDWTTGTHLMVSGFYKRLQNVINDSENTIEQVGQGTGTIVSQPVNGNDGKVYGLELAARQVFKFLPEPFDGLGVSAVVSRQYTSVDLGDPSLSNDERILNVPDWLANVEVFYTRGGLSLGLVYNYSSEFIEKYDYIDQPGNWDDLWQRSRRRLDMHAGYEFQSGLEVDLSIGNVLKDYIYWSHIGRDSLAISDVIDTGITGRLTTTYKF